MVPPHVTASRLLIRTTYVRVLTFLTILGLQSMPAVGKKTDLVTAAVNPGNRVLLRGQHAPWARPENYWSRVPGDLMLEHMTLILKRAPERQKAFETFLQQLQDRSSPDYHRWLTPLQLGRRFGASQHDIDTVRGWLSSQGLHVNSVANNRVMIDFSGTAAQIEAALATQMSYYLVNGEERIGGADDPQIPAALADVIQAISGLYTVNDHSYHGAEQVEVPAHGAHSDSPALSICSGATCNYFVTPNDFDVIYDVNTPYSGVGQTIAIIGRARVYDPDIQNFESLTGLPQQTPTVIVPPNGLDPGSPAGTGGEASGDQVEATIDVMRSTSVAPGATIDLVVSADNNGTSGLRIAAQYVVDTSPVFAQAMNLSFGACEADRTQADVQFWDTTFAQAAGEGISVFVASGDAGAAGCDSYFQVPPQMQIASPNYICASSYGTCVGGTEFADASDPSQYWSSTNNPFLGSALMYIPEGGWNEPLNGSGKPQAAASGGGVSAYIATPSWQVGTGVPGTQGRYTPDIAFSSSAHDGYFGCLAASGGTHPGDCVVHNGGFYFEYFFGTSCAAPGMAGILALLNQELGGPQGQLNPRLYALAANPSNQVFHDVTVATSAVSNCEATTPSMCNNSTPSPTGLTGGLSGYLVNAGFDLVTGWGSIKVANLLGSWTAESATTTTLNSSANPAALGDNVTFTSTVATSGSNPPTGNVTFYDGTTVIGMGTLNGSELAAAASSSLAVGTHSITAVYQGDANNAASTSPVLMQTISPPTFKWAANGSNTGNVLSGQTAIYSFTATPGGSSFAANVTFSCSGLPDKTVGCSFNPPAINAGSGTTTIQLMMATTGPNPPTGAPRQQEKGRHALWLPLAVPLAGVVMVGLRTRRASKRVAFIGGSVSLVLLAMLIACGGGGSSPPIAVSVSPGNPASVFPNDKADGWPSQTAQFTASVMNSSNTAVTWAVSTPNGGSIDATGLYTAPTVAAGLPPTVTITATAVADGTKSGATQETLNAATVPGTYSNIMVTATESTTVNAVPVTLVVQ